MDLFILDSQLRRTALYDRYTSLIWTERFSSQGDFELVINSTLDTRNAFLPGTRLAINESTRVMTIETVEDKQDSEGRTILTVKGPSLEDLLTERVARDIETAPQPQVNWTLGPATPAFIARLIFDKICIQGLINVGDKIPYYTAGNIYPANTIPESPTNVTLSVPVQTVYDAIKSICDIYGLGFRLVRNGDTSQLMFNIYSGNDRTTLQSALPAVIFAPELDNLTDVKYLTSIGAYKNVAYVVAPNASLMVYAANVDPAVAGFDRKTLYVNASDITDAAGAGLTAKLTQRGKEQLALNTNLAAFDGEVSKNSQYIYHRDYELGDIVEIRNSDKATNQMIVTEQIFVSDAQGDRSYPTLAVKLLITPGSWYAVPSTQVWDDIIDVADVWGTRP